VALVCTGLSSFRDVIGVGGATFMNVMCHMPLCGLQPLVLRKAFRPLAFAATTLCHRDASQVALEEAIERCTKNTIVVAT
jgi:hypothetical protein